MSNYKLVPVEPAPKMLQVWKSMYGYSRYDKYKAMLAEAPVINIVATKNEQGQIVSVTLQDEDHRILEVIAEADVQGEVGEGVPDYINDAIDNLYHDNYELSHGGYLERTRDVELIRTYIARTGQPTEQQPDDAQLAEALEGIMRVEARDRVMPVGAEWDAARAALAAYRKHRGEA